MQDHPSIAQERGYEILFWAHSNHWGSKGTPETPGSSQITQKMFQMGIITISELQDIADFGDFAIWSDFFHFEKIDIWWCAIFFPMKRIHKKLGVTSFGRWGARKWVLLNREPCDFRYTTTIHREDMPLSDPQLSRSKTGLRRFAPSAGQNWADRIWAAASL